MVALLLMQDSMALALLAAKGVFLACVQLSVQQDLTFFSESYLLAAWHPASTDCCMGLGISPAELPKVPDSPFSRSPGWKHNPLVHRPVLLVFVLSADLCPYLKAFRLSCSGLYRASVLFGASLC